MFRAGREINTPIKSSSKVLKKEKSYVKENQMKAVPWLSALWEFRPEQREWGELQGRELFAQVTVQRLQRAFAVFWESVPKAAEVLLLKDKGINPRVHRGPGNREQSGKAGKGHFRRHDHVVSDPSVLRWCGPQLGFAWLTTTLHEPQEMPHSRFLSI